MRILVLVLEAKISNKRAGDITFKGLGFKDMKNITLQSGGQEYRFQVVVQKLKGIGGAEWGVKEAK